MLSLTVLVRCNFIFVISCFFGKQKYTLFHTFQWTRARKINGRLQ